MEDEDKTKDEVIDHLRSTPELKKWLKSTLHEENSRASHWTRKLITNTTNNNNKHFERFLTKSALNKTENQREQETCQQIEKDLPRTGSTFENCGLSKPGEKMWESLKRILTAYANYNKETGYVQSMNFISAFLLLSGMNENEAFWSLDVIVSEIVKGYFTEGMVGAARDQKIFARCIHRMIPELGVHLDALATDNIVSAITSSQWLLTLFVNVLPTRLTFRVWDRVIESKHRAPLFAASVALLEANVERLLDATELGEAVERLQNLGKDVGSSEQSLERFENRFDMLCKEMDETFLKSVEDEVLEEDGDLTTCLKREREEVYRKMISEGIPNALDIIRQQQQQQQHNRTKNQRQLIVKMISRCN